MEYWRFAKRRELLEIQIAPPKYLCQREIEEEPLETLNHFKLCALLNPVNLLLLERWP